MSEEKQKSEDKTSVEDTESQASNNANDSETV